MKDIIGTLIIMLLCITALSRAGASEHTIILSKPDKQKPEIKHKAKTKQSKPQEKSVMKLTEAPQFISPVSVQVLAGTQGLGADVKYGYLPKLSGRLGFGIIPVNAGRNFNFSSFPAEGQLNARFSNLHLLAEYAPFKTTNFRLVGGAAYLIQGNANVIVTPSGTYHIGSQSITSNQFGDIQAGVTWKGVAPYLGFALFRSFPQRLFNVNLDIGTYYLSSPGTSFTGTKLLEDNNSNAKQFNENMQGYRWLPVVQFNFNFRIK